LQIFYSGRVQGVGFRYAVKALVPGFEVTGLIRNLPNGRVELVAEGEKAELEAFQLAIRDSGLNRFIEREQVFWEETQGVFRSFDIVR